MRARLAANARWSATPDRQAATAKSRQAWFDKWEKEVDPEGILAPDVRAKLAKNAMHAHMARMAFNSSKARRKTAKKKAGE